MKRWKMIFALCVALTACQSKEAEKPIKQKQEMQTVREQKPERTTKHIKELDQYKEQNKDVVGILQIPNTKIDYPVVQAEDNDYYLRRAFNGEYFIKGSIFMDYEDDLSKDPENIIIYGHNMEDFNDREMFKDITLYKEKNFFNRNKLFHLYTYQGDRIYEVVGLYIIDVEKEFFPYHTYIQKDDTMDSRKYIEALAPYAKNVRGMNIKPEDKLITLSTCTYEGNNVRCVLVGRELTEY